MMEKPEIMRFEKLLVLLISLSGLQGIVPLRITASSPPPEVTSSPKGPASGKINEAEIRSMIAEIQAALKTRNTAGIVKYYAPFITSELTVKTGNRSETFELDGLQENANYLGKIFREIQSIEVLSEDWDVDILATDEMALIHRQRVVNITATDGKRYIVESSAIARVAPVDGQLKILSIQETAEVSQRPQS